MFTGVAKVQGSNPCKPENPQAFFSTAAQVTYLTVKIFSEFIIPHDKKKRTAVVEQVIPPPLKEIISLMQFVIGLAGLTGHVLLNLMFLNLIYCSFVFVLWSVGNVQCLIFLYHCNFYSVVILSLMVLIRYNNISTTGRSAR